MQPSEWHGGLAAMVPRPCRHNGERDSRCRSHHCHVGKNLSPLPPPNLPTRLLPTNQPVHTQMQVTEGEPEPGHRILVTLQPRQETLRQITQDHSWGFPCAHEHTALLTSNPPLLPHHQTHAAQATPPPHPGCQQPHLRVLQQSPRKHLPLPPPLPTL
jgi:hypothetical protein